MHRNARPVEAKQCCQIPYEIDLECIDYEEPSAAVESGVWKIADLAGIEVFPASTSSTSSEGRRVNEAELHRRASWLALDCFASLICSFPRGSPAETTNEGKV